MVPGLLSPADQFRELSPFSSDSTFNPTGSATLIGEGVVSCTNNPAVSSRPSVISGKL